MTPTANLLEDSPRMTRRPRAFHPMAFVSASASAFVFACTLTLSGCGEGSSPVVETTYPVKGKVVLTSGKPLTDGKVIFLPRSGMGMPATGEIGTDGTFSLKSPDGREGAAPGDYKIRIEPADKYGPKFGSKVAPPPLPFSDKYLDEDGDTDLTATVKTGETTLDPFKLSPRGADVASTSRGRH